MAERHQVVVDGSNLATEGRTIPSLAQLDEAVRAYLEEDPLADPVVVVDASFAHRIDAKERDQLEQAELHGEVVSPPAGAIGRGDAFVLRIAERTGAVVLSNDSFQEFHGEHPWLFDPGRLIGGKPVPGVGWIFTPRLPVRGAKSRKATKENADAPADELTPPRKAAEVAKALLKAERAAEKASLKAKDAARKDVTGGKPARKKKESTKEKGEPGRTRHGRQADGAQAAPLKAAAKAAPKAKGVAKAAKDPAAVPAGRRKAAKETKPTKGATAKVTARPAKATRAKSPAKRVDPAPATTPRPARVRRAISDATAEVLTPEAPGEAKKRQAPKRGSGVPPPAVNDPLAFIRFVANHSLGGELEGEVVSFTSHGAMVDVDLPESGVLHCYIPLRGLGDPAPRKAREVLTRGRRRSFVLVGLDPPRRMAELATPEMAPGILALSAGPDDTQRSPRRRSRVGGSSKAG